MDKNIKQAAVSDQALELVSGGGPDFYAEYPVYSVGQRVRFQYFTDYNFTPAKRHQCLARAFGKMRNTMVHVKQII